MGANTIVLAGPNTILLAAPNTIYLTHDAEPCLFVSLAVCDTATVGVHVEPDKTAITIEVVDTVHLGVDVEDCC